MRLKNKVIGIFRSALFGGMGDSILKEEVINKFVMQCELLRMRQKIKSYKLHLGTASKEDSRILNLLAEMDHCADSIEEITRKLAKVNIDEA